MSTVLLGAVNISPEQTQVSPSSSGAYTVTTDSSAGNEFTLADQPNPDGSYNIALPPDTPREGVVAKETDAPTGEGDEPGGDEPGAEGMNLKKVLPLVLVAAVAFWYFTKRKK